jgi:hypothetical protein
MRRKYTIILKAGAAAAAGLVVLLFFVTISDFFLCFGSAGRLPFLKSYPVMTVLIYGTTYDAGINTVSARIMLTDTHGKEIAAVERSWKGWSISVEFLSTDFSGKKILFPARIKGSDDRRQGTNLLPYYNENGESLLLGGGATRSERRDLYRLCMFAAHRITAIFSKFVRRQKIDLSVCRTGVYYTLYAGFDGQVVVVPD